MITKEEGSLHLDAGPPTTSQHAAIQNPDLPSAFGLSIEKWSPKFSLHPDQEVLHDVSSYDKWDFCVHKDMICALWIGYRDVLLSDALFFTKLANEESSDQTWPTRISILGGDTIDETVAPTIVSDGHTLAAFVMYGSVLRRYVSTNDGVAWALSGSYTFSSTVKHMAAVHPETIYFVCSSAAASDIYQVVVLQFDGTNFILPSQDNRPILPYLPNDFDAERLGDLGWGLSFDGTDRINLASPTVLDDLPDGGQVTYELCVQIDSSIAGGYTARLLSKGSGMYIVASSSNGIAVNIPYGLLNATSRSGIDELVPADGKKHHILVTYDEAGTDTPEARKAYISIDGRWVESYTTQQASTGSYATDAADDMEIGNISPYTEGLQGVQGWGRVSNIVRYKPADGNFTPPDVDVCPYNDSDTVWLGISEGEGTTIKDRSSNGNDGTLTGGSWIANNRGPDVLVFSTDLPPYCGDRADGTSVGYKRQGLVAVSVNWATYGLTDPSYDMLPMFSDLSPVEVFDRAGPNQHRSDIRLSKCSGRLFLTAWGQEGANDVPSSDWLDEPEALFMYWSSDGKNWTTGNMIASTEFVQFTRYYDYRHEGIAKLLYNPPYVYLVDALEQWRSYSTRLFGLPHDDASVDAVIDNATRLGLNYGAASQSSWELSDPSGEIGESILSEPGEHIVRLFIGVIDGTDVPRLLIATQWPDRVTNSAPSDMLKMVCRGPVGKLVDDSIVPHTQDFIGRVFAMDDWTVSGYDVLSHVAGITGTWDVVATYGLEVATVTRGSPWADQMHSTWLSNFVDGLAAFSFRLPSGVTGIQGAGMKLRSYGRYENISVGYTWDSDATHGDHDDLVLYASEGSFTKVGSFQTGMGWSLGTTYYLRANIYRQKVWLWYSTNGREWTLTSGSPLTLDGESSELTGPEDTISWKKPMIGQVGLGAFQDNTEPAGNPTFSLLKFASAHPAYTLEDVIKKLCAHAAIPNITFNSAVKELPNTDGEYDLDNFTAGTGTLSLVDNRMLVEGVSTPDWGYATYDYDIPNDFKLTFVMSAAWGEVRFRGGDTYDQEYFAFGWGAGYIWIGHKDASTYYNLDRIVETAPTETEITIVFRGMSYSLDNSEVDYYAVSVEFDGQQKLFAIVNPTWTPENKLRFAAYNTTGDAYFSKIHIAELTEFIDYLSIDYGQPLTASLRNAIGDRPVEMIPRFDGGIHFRRIGPLTPAHEFRPEDLISFTRDHDRRQVRTHFRVQGADEEIDYIDKDMINEGYGRRFRLIKNPNLMTLSDIERDGPDLISLEFEKAYSAVIIAHGDPTLEVGDMVVCGVMDSRIIATELGVLSYPTDSRFQDTLIEQNGSSVPWYKHHSTESPAWNLIIITNSDNTICWGYIGAGATTTRYCDIWQDADMTTLGFNGYSTQPNTDGKTPVSYKIKRAGLWIIEQLQHEIKGGEYIQQLSCRGYDRRKS